MASSNRPFVNEKGSQRSIKRQLQHGTEEAEIHAKFKPRVLRQIAAEAARWAKVLHLQGFWRSRDGEKCGLTAIRFTWSHGTGVRPRAFIGIDSS
jgi:hypothetical protein